MGRLKFDAGGVMFALDQTFLRAGPDSKFKSMFTEVEQTDGSPFIINRPPELFGAIVSLYMLGELHIPVTSCPVAVLKEMEFWEVDVNNVSTCCLYRIQEFQEQQARLTKFRQHITAEPDGLKIMACDSMSNLRSTIWSIVEYRGQNILNKLYFALVCAMIILSILTISLGTCESFKRNMTNCERLEFMQEADMAGTKLFASYMEQNQKDCGDTALPDQKYGSSYYGSAFDYEYNYEFINLPELSTQGYPTAPPSYVSVKVPNMKLPIRALVVLDVLTLVFFTFDLALRLTSCPSLLTYFKSVINIADAAALICSYIYLIVIAAGTNENYVDNWIDFLGFIVILRTFRLFRIAKNVNAGRILAFTLIQNLKELIIGLIFFVLCVCMFSSVVYFIERQEEYNRFLTIPDCWYWAAVTMTTVGYGDMIPVTIPGRFIACLCAVCGVIFLAITAAIFTHQFLFLYRYANPKCITTKKWSFVDKKKDIHGAIKGPDSNIENCS